MTSFNLQRAQEITESCLQIIAIHHIKVVNLFCEKKLHILHHSLITGGILEIMPINYKYIIENVEIQHI